MRRRAVHSLLFWCIGLLLPSVSAYAQPVLEFSSQEPQFVTPCGPEASFGLTISNTGADPLTASTLSLNLPDGILYLAGSVTGATEADVTNPDQPLFDLGALAPGAEVSVTVLTSVECALLSFSDPLINAWEVDGSDGSFSFNSSPYNVNLPALTTSNPQNLNYQGQVGDSFVRTFEITNTGFGTISQLTLEDVFSASVNITAAAPGTFQVVGNTASLVLSAGEFSTVGNGDGFLDQGESITVSESVTIIDCAPGSSDFTLSWGCNGNSCGSIPLNASVTILTQLPNLNWEFVAQDYAGFCESGNVVVEIVNAGSGSGGTSNAFNIVLEPGMGTPGNNVLPGRDGCLQLTGFAINGQSLLPDTMNYSGHGLELSQLTTDPDGPGGLTDLDGDGQYDDLPVGESIQLSVDIIPDAQCFDGDCPGAIPATAFKLRHVLQNQCEQMTEGQVVNDTHLYELSTGTVSDNLEPYYTFGEALNVLMLLSREITGFDCSNGDLELEITLPPAMVLQPGGQVLVNGNPVPFTQTGNMLSLNADIGEVMLQIPVNTICDSTFVELANYPCAIVQPTPIVHEIRVGSTYFCDSACSEGTDFFCGSSTAFIVRCENDLTVPEEGISAYDFRVERLSLGWTDASLTTRVDPLSPGLALNNAMVHDTVRFEIDAEVFGPSDYTDSKLYLFYFNDSEDPYFDVLQAELQFFDVETNATLACDPLSAPVVTEEEGAHSITYDLTPLFGVGGCAEGLDITAGDSLSVALTVVMNSGLPNSLSEIPGFHTGFLFDFNGDEISCNEERGPLMVVNPDLQAEVVLETGDTACDTLRFAAQLLQGRPAFGPTDPFPFEYRPYAHFDSVYFDLPPDLQYLPGSAEVVYEYRADLSTDGPIDTATQVLPDPVITPLPGGGLRLGFLQTDSFPYVDVVHGQTLNNLAFQVFPVCMPQTDLSFSAELGFTRYYYAEEQRVSSNRNIEESEDYQQGVQTVVVFDPSFDGQLDTASWVFEVCHTSVGTGNPLNLPNNFMWFDLPVSGVTPLTLADVTNPQNPVFLPLNVFDGGEDRIGLLGTLSPDSCRLYELLATYTNCDPVDIPMHYDFRCAGYPQDSLELAESCGSSGFSDTLSILPQDALLQINLVDNPANPVDLCTPLSYEIQLINTQPGRAYGTEVFIEIPAGSGLSLVPGSCTWEYGAGGFLPLPDPQTVPGTDQYVWDMEQISAALADQGLGGAGQSIPTEIRIRFELETDCSFVNLSVWSYFAAWENACGSIGQTATFFAPAVQVIGIPLTLNAYDLQFVGPPLQNCGDPVSFSATIISEGPDPTSSTEVIRFELENGFAYNPNSFQGIYNYPGTAEPVIYTPGGSYVLEWDMPDGVMPGDSVQFSFELVPISGSLADCSSSPANFSVIDVAVIPCSTAPGGACELEFGQSDTTFTLSVDAALYDLVILNANSQPLDAGSESYALQYQINNTGTFPGAGNLQLSFYLDTNGSGAYEAGSDQLVTQTNFDASGLGPGQSAYLNQSFAVAGANTCDGILVVLETIGNPCICAAAEAWFPPLMLENVGSADTLCYAQPLELGTTPVQGYSYQWSPDTYLSDPTAANPEYAYTGPLNPGDVLSDTLILETTRAAGCSTLDTLVLTIRRPLLSLEAITDYNGFSISCPGAADGGLDAMVTGGTAPYSWTWDPALPGSPPQSDLPEGMYQLIVTDALGCTATDTASLVAPPALSNTFQLSDYNGFSVSCAGANDGSIGSLPSGGVGDYQWQWTGGPDTAEWSDLSAGTYTVQITDANGCELTDLVSLIEPPALTLDWSSSPILCADGNNGSVTLTVSGGVGPYAYAGNSFDPTWTVPGLDTPGDYDLLVTDANGCPAEVVATVEQLTSEFSLESTPILCPDGTEGSLCVLPVNAHPPYAYTWSVGSSNDCLGELTAGTYQVTVTDGNGCIYLLADTLDQPTAFSLNFSSDSVQCFGSSDGSLSVAATGGSPPYSYNWSGGFTGPDLTDIAAGNYTLTLTDDFGCEWTGEAEVGSPTEVQLSLSEVDVTCHAGEDGALAATATGGTPPYSYAWATGQNGALINELSAGLYTLAVTDAAGCSATISGEVQEPPFPSVNLEETDISCFGFNDGQLEILDPTGSGYTYSLDGASFQAGTVFSDLTPGTYTLYLQDPDGCTYDYPAFLTEPSRNLFEVSPDQEINLGESADLFAYPLTFINSYLWDPPGSLDCFDCPAVLASPLATTTYLVTAISENGCLETEQVTVRVLIPEDVYIPNIFSPDFDGVNDAFLIFSGPSVERIEYLRIFDRWGGQVFATEGILPNDPQQGWDGTVRGQPANQGVYAFVAEVVYIDGRRRLFKGDVTLVR